MDKIELKSAVEAILFASGEPVSAARIAIVTDSDEADVLEAGAELAAEYESQKRGIRLVRLNDSLQLHSAPEHADAITRALEQRRAPKLSPASLEVLAIAAYFQPVTRAYIEQMRGVDSSYTVGVLTERGMIEPCGQLDHGPVFADHGHFQPGRAAPAARDQRQRRGQTAAGEGGRPACGGGSGGQDRIRS